MRHSSKDRERQLRFSIRKFTAGVASVAIASLYFLSASPASADSHTLTLDSVDLSSLTDQERQQITFALPPEVSMDHASCYILVYQPKGSTTNVVAVSPATGSGRTTGGSAKSQLMKALPSTGSKELDVAFYGLGAGMLGLAGYMLWKNKKSGKYLLVAVIAVGGVASSVDVMAAMKFLAPTQHIVIEDNQKAFRVTPQEIEGYEYVGYMTKDCELIPADKADADEFAPVGQGQTVEQGGQPDPAKSISNLVDLPKGTTVAFKTPVDTTTAGEKDAVVVVTYPDGSSEEVAVKVTIAPKAPVTQPTGPTAPTQKDADRHTPVGQAQVVELGQPVDAAGSISNLVELPTGTTAVFENPVDTSTPGAKDAVVIVMYPDGSFDKVPVTIGVTETIKISHSETHNPHGHNQTVTVGSAVDATKSISDFSSLIAGTTATFAVPVDTTTPGVKDAVVVVTYPDGSTDIVSVQVTVNAIPRTEDQTVHVGEAPAPERSVPNLDQLPPGTSVAFKEPVDTTTIGDKEAIIVVTYPDGTTEERPVVVTVIVDPTPVPVIPNVDTFNPFGQPQTVTQGGTVEATGSIANFDDLIPGTTATFVTPVDTTTPGDKPATVLVSYPDGTSETVDVTVTVLEATKPTPTPDTSAPKLNEPAKTPVADKTNLTDAEKAKVEEEVKKANPELPADAEITVGNDGAVTVKVPGKDEATLTPAQTVVDKPDTSAPKLNEPAKTPVADKTNLTDDEKAKVAEEVKKANPELPADAEITVGNDGSVSVKVPNRDAATLTPAQTVVDKPDTSAPKLNEPAKTPVADKTNLTDAEKAKVEEEVKKANPELPADAEITVGNDGAVTVKVPGKDEATLTPAQTVVDKPDTSAPKLNEPAKTPVADKTNLTDAEKAKVEEEVKKANPELPADAEITVGNDGSVSVKVPNRDAATLTPAQTVVEKPDTSAPKLNEPAKTPVADKTNLTDAEKAKVEEEVKKANPELPADAEITVGNDGTVTVTYPDKTTDELTPEVTVEQKPKDTDRITPNNPVKTPVADLTKLTDDEKTKVADEVKKANPDFPAGTEVTVGNDGKVTITYPDKTTDELTPEVTVEQKPKDTDRITPNNPVKTPVADLTKLTDDEKTKVADEVKKANPDFPAGTEVTVGNDGTVTVTYPDKTTDELTPEVTVEQKPKDTDRITPNNPVKTPVADLTKLTDDEKTKVADEVKKANPDFPAGTEVTVGNDGKVTITYPDKTTDELTPEVTVEQKPKDTDRITPNNPVKTPVADLTKLTDDEKTKVADEVKKANPDFPAGTEVTVGNDGTVTVTYPDKTTDELTPEVTVEQKPKDTDRITPNNPVKTPVADLTKLTDDEKTKVADEVKKANPDFPAGTEVTVGNDGKVTITYPDKTTDELTPEVTVEQKPKDTDRITPNNPAKTPVADLTKLTDDEKTKVADEVKKVNPDFPAGTEVIVGNDGKVTITYPDKTTDELTPEVTVEQKPKDTDRITPNNPAKTPVADLTKLTDDEKTKVADEVKKANPDFPAGTEVTVGNDGTVTVTYPDKTTDELTPEVTVEQKPKDTDRITPNNPAKTPVADLTKLTDDEKTKVADEVKKANPDFPAGTEVTVGNDGKVTITYPDKTTDELTPEVTVEQKPKDTDRITPNNPAKTPVADLTKLTDDEKTKVADEVKKANPDFPAGTEVTVGNDGTVTITYPDKTTDELTPEVTVEQKPKDTDRITPNNPVKTPVADKTNLTDDEKAKVADEVKKANPDFPAGTEVTVGNDGKVTITYPDKTTDELTPEVTVEQKPKDTDRITPNNPVKTPVADLTKLTDDEKTKVADEVKKANPDFPAGTEVTVGNDGTVTVTYPDKTTDELTPEVTVEQKPKDTDRITPNNPVKTPVADKTNLTDDEKAKVADEVKKANPDFPAGTEVTVGNDGKVTITYPDKTTDELTPEVTVEEQEQLLVNAPALTPVADKSNLTSDEKAAVQAAIKAANPTLNLTDEQIVVNNDGSTTITVPGKDEATLTSAQTVTDQEQLSVTPPALTPVADKSNLTTDEKAAVTAAIKAANPTLNLTDEQIVVNNDGSTTITVPGKKPASLTQAQTVTDQEQLSVTPPALTPVADKSNLTTDEKAAVKAAIKAVNPTLNLTDEQIVVGNDGSTTITVPGKKPASLTPAQTVTDQEQLSVTPPALTPVADKSSLTSDEKAAVTAAIKAANPTLNLTDEQIVVNNDGSTTITVPGKKPASLTPAQTVTDQEQLSVTPPALTPVADKSSLTSDEKAAVTAAIKAANPTLNLTDEQIVVNNDGSTTITVPGKKPASLTPAQTVTDQEQLSVTPPALTPVADKSSLTSDEKAAVTAAIKAANPTLNLTDEQIVVGNDGSTTITVPGKKPASLTPAQTVEQKPQVDPNKFTLSNVSISLASKPTDTSTGGTEDVTISGNSVAWGIAGRNNVPNSSLRFDTSGSASVAGESGVELVIGSVVHHNAGLAGRSNLLREIDVNMTYTITANGATPEARTFKLGRLFVMEASSGSYDYFVLETSTDSVTIGNTTYEVKVSDFIPKTAATGAKVSKAQIAAAYAAAQANAKPKNLQAFLNSPASDSALYVATLENVDGRTGRGSDNPFDIKVTVTVKP